MASRNSRKVYIAETFYHIYNRGVNKQPIFLDEEDRATFLNLCKRYLSDQPAKDKKGREYPWLSPEIELLAFCLMRNHFHFLVYQLTEPAFRKLLKNVCGTYTVYFNKKYGRVGPLFQDRFKASMILTDNYLQHITRYIHRNPGKLRYKTWPYSSLRYYDKSAAAEWVRPERILEIFDNNSRAYMQFMDDYDDYKSTEADIQPWLAI